MQNRQRPTRLRIIKKKSDVTEVNTAYAWEIITTKEIR